MWGIRGAFAGHSSRTGQHQPEGTRRVDEAPVAAEGTAPDAGERRYANHLRIGFNQLEFLLDFAQAYEGAGDLVHTRLVAAPAHVKQFAELLDGCVAEYEQRYGPIRMPADASIPGRWALTKRPPWWRVISVIGIWSAFFSSGPRPICGSRWRRFRAIGLSSRSFVRRIRNS